MPQLISIDWEADDLTGVEASVSDGEVRVRRCFNFVWPENIVPAEEPQRAGEWLAKSLKEAGVTADQALVVLPREAIVVRRLDLPNAPDAELPDLVRFQAATKSSTSLDRLVLDYVPLPTRGGGRGPSGADGDGRRPATADGSRRRSGRRHRTQAPSASARSPSPNWWRDIEGKHSADPLEATLAIYQDTHRVEITILQQRRVVFSHQTRLTGSDDAGGIRSSIVEINRASVALSQSQHDVQITDVCLIHAGDADPALETALDERFRGQLHVLDVATRERTARRSPEDRAALARFAPAVGMLLSHSGAQVPAVDFLHPRQREVKQDRTKLKAGTGGRRSAVGGRGRLSAVSLAPVESERPDRRRERAGGGTHARPQSGCARTGSGRPHRRVDCRRTRSAGRHDRVETTWAGHGPAVPQDLRAARRQSRCDRDRSPDWVMPSRGKTSKICTKSSNRPGFASCPM